MKKETIIKILNEMLATGGDFAESFLEHKTTKRFTYINNRLDQVAYNEISGIGLRLAQENNMYYASTNDLTLSNLLNLASELKENLTGKRKISLKKLERLKSYSYKLPYQYTDLELRDKLKEINDLIRKQDKRIEQVSINLSQVHDKVLIANHRGLYRQEKRIRTRLFIQVYFKDQEKIANVHFSKGLACGYELLDTIDFPKEVKRLLKLGLDKLYAKPCVGKVMPVIIGSGFGGVIFHEACGHAMEATSVADGLSVLSGKLNQVIASPKVTIIDDGTIKGAWGSNMIDDEGRKTQKNVLIKDGVLVNYLIDELNNRKMHMQETGSARREDYTFAPTSRMNNTYLAKGTDKIEDMIKSIDLGLYAVSLGGGSVSPETGDFNFGCDEAYMIRGGKVAEAVSMASLIGNTKDILKEVEMVSDDLALGEGMCGSLSGSVPVNVGEPTIKVGHILVGGVKDV